MPELADKMKVLLIDVDLAKIQDVSDALCDSRYSIAQHQGQPASLLKMVDSLQPDIIVIDIESPSRDMLESLSAISNFNPKPVVMFSTQNDTEVINQSIQSGVSAYVVGDVEPSRVKPILDAAVARFTQFHQMKNQLYDTQQQLNAKEIVDKAKRALIKQKSLTEEQAFHSMRKTAMDSGQCIEDVAKTVLSILNNLDTGARSR
ncbi:ANTAR domain-containing protein [Aliiglaciecola sp. LCG003]|uniref:ANTAR domain-containing response regulator n=1 Tax=Aliiglaciecola sp. LCG003 TaxID=3053655 RepID=UPI002572D897|nr:ANTAR domain-containing protein [Aliiglaciecola sp. LCG003]WJG11113.1 ANTAR domain-containing protein [Aliiglaciecola sp. LCG003]